MPVSFDEAVAFLTRRLREPLPGTDAQLRLAPAYRMDPVLARVENKSCREAAVLALLFPLQNEPAVVLTARHAGLKDHAGQIAFPGGRREPEEPLETTAVREAHEEIGLDPSRVEILGTLTPLFIPPSNFCVYPFIGIVRELPELSPHDEEVDAILYVPIRHLLDPAMLLREAWLLRGREVEVPFFSYESYKVWGATAMMLSELLAIFEELETARG